jgi:hypothetical protein
VYTPKEQRFMLHPLQPMINKAGADSQQHCSANQTQDRLKGHRNI